MSARIATGSPENAGSEARSAACRSCSVCADCSEPGEERPSCGPIAQPGASRRRAANSVDTKTAFMCRRIIALPRSVDRMSALYDRRALRFIRLAQPRSVNPFAAGEWTRKTRRREDRIRCARGEETVSACTGATRRRQSCMPHRNGSPRKKAFTIANLRSRTAAECATPSLHSSIPPRSARTERRVETDGHLHGEKKRGGAGIPRLESFPREPDAPLHRRFVQNACRQVRFRGRDRRFRVRYRHTSIREGCPRIEPRFACPCRTLRALRGRTIRRSHP